jgi:glucose-6-phosphate dehydrogenase assembly protein OpcA
MKLGQAWETNPAFKTAFHRFHTVVIVLLLAAIVWFLWTHWKDRVRPSEA